MVDVRAFADADLDNDFVSPEPVTDLLSIIGESVVVAERLGDIVLVPL